jgi:hypothetical protein
VINIKSADLTNSTQKFIAAMALGVVLIVLYFLLPPLITIFTNLWILAAVALPFLFLVFNYQAIWELFKRLSWDMTKTLISSDKLWYMYQYYNYMVKKLEELNTNIVNVGAIETSTQRSINQMIRDCDNTKAQAIQLEKQNAAASVQKVAKGKVGLLQQQIDTFLPKLDFIKAQKKALTELYEAWSADTELLKSTLDAKAEEYKLMKQLSSASDSAKAFLQKDSPELKAYNESLKQIEQSVAQYTSNVENFQREIGPKLTQMSASNALNEQAGTDLIEAYKKNRIQL